MKKFTVLTSVLALAACGGGSGGPGAPVRVTQNEGFLSATPEAVESNKEITTMVSEIDICTGNCDSPRQDVARVSTKEINGKTFKVYNLDDVNFLMADEGFGGEMNFNIDDTTKKIIGVTVGAEDEDAKYFERQNDNSFTGQVTIEGGQQADGILNYTSVAKAKNLGLRYSDFGKVEVQVRNPETNTFEHAQTFVFIGGYDDASQKRIAENNIDSEKTFSGYATGSVTSILHDRVVEEGQEKGKTINLDTSTNSTKDKFATLTFNNGTSTLNAKFDNWYDVKHVKSSTDEYIEFSNFTTQENLTITDGTQLAANDFRMVSNPGDEPFELHNNQYHEYEEGQRTEETGNSLNSDIRYYGDNNKPSEAVEMLQIRDVSNYDGNINDHENLDEIRMNLSFGGTVVNQ